ncbi:hypothetical protein PENSTE_c030G02933 [Penicillium steckii]|uniref:DUF7779 domain-containing protein n=1 Tax=Penicillium steckii TaxID=303698 RepID=A0A1V6SM01_9EURO|nr:hypothetical protein PENSTE_c030G02933 [Penicillium steckii]
MQPEPSEPRPDPLSTVPFLHDPDFVSRDKLFAQIEEKSSTPGSRVALVGLGGVGKTRLAIEYCYRVRQQLRNTWVFWVHASSVARCEKSLRDLADRVKIPGPKELEFMPLAVIQAASYIIHHSPRCSVSQYLKRLQKSDRRAINLLKRETHLLRDWEAKDSIILTWQISFDYIRRIRRSATNLLSLMSLYDRQGVPEFLLRSRNDGNDDYSELSEDSTNNAFEKDTDRSVESSVKTESDPDDQSDFDEEFEEDIATLKNYSFISTGEDSRLLTMHRLVQLTVHAWLEREGQLELWREHAINNLYYYLPRESKDWEICEKVSPHIRSTALRKPKSQCSQRKLSSLELEVARYGTNTIFDLLINDRSCGEWDTLHYCVRKISQKLGS